MPLSSQALLHDLAGDVLRRVVARFDEAGIPALAVKGAVTAHTLYEDPAERPISDIDIRVNPEDFDACLALGQRAGWKVHDVLPAYGNLVFEIAGLLIDVESSVGPPGLCDLSIAEMRRRAAPMKHPRGFSVLVPEVHDHALFLCVNAFKDKLVQAARWSVEDLVRIVRSTDFDVGRFVERSAQARARGIVWTVADWLVRTRSDAVWMRIRDALGASPRPVFTWAYGQLVRRMPDSAALRLLARAGNDDPRKWPRAFVTAFRFEAEMGRRTLRALGARIRDALPSRAAP